MTWTEEDIATVERLWNEGLSASEIVPHLTVKKSRNAVIGKVHRLGLAGRYVEIRKTQRVFPKPKQLGAVKVKPKKVSPLASLPTEPLPKEDIPPANLISIEDLENHHCRWVYGDPKHEHGFCGKHKVIGLAYCIDHARRSYVPPSPLKNVRHDIRQKVGPYRGKVMA